MAEIRNLVFEGGGVRGAAYGGAVQVLEKKGALARVARIAGTSVGSITATFLATGGGSAGLLEWIRHTDFRTFLDGFGGVLGNSVRILEHHGMHAGEEMIAILKRNIGRFSGDPELTFRGLSERVSREPGRFAQLFVIASNLTKQRAQVLSAATTPDVPLWLAVRASVSIPLIFEPVKINGDLFVDGGLSWNYAIDLFDHDEVGPTRPCARRPGNDETLGFVLWNKAETAGRGFAVRDRSVVSLTDFLSALGGFMYEEANRRHIHPDDLARSVFIDDLGISSTSFDEPPERIEALIASGSAAMEGFLAERQAGGGPGRA
ncbi:MAG: patatin-like phospholipase family protein [Planctomycetes bacterium]|nr:patatin-like phospholipase family protein [Planctomycetota bacterium]